MRNHAKLKNQSEHTLEYLKLFIVHEFAQVDHKVFKVCQIYVVFEKL